MHKKIYFGSKPLLLADAKTEEIERYLSDDKTIVASNLDSATVKAVIRQIQQPEIQAGVYLHQNAEELFRAVAGEFSLVPAAGGLVHSEEQILLIFRRGKWDLPKGKLDEGEKPDICALREVEEETGLKNIVLDRPLCVTYHTYYEGSKHVLKDTHWFLMQANQKQVLTPQTEEDIEKCEWVKPENLAPYLENTFPAIIDVIKEAVAVLHEGKKL